MSCNVPVLLIFFNRPNMVKEVFSEIRKAKPKKLYLSQDAPRDGVDEIAVQKCREIVSNVDWDCEVFTNYHNKNLGCGEGPFDAINWVFKNEERAIILEDDCIPSQSFFKFCDDMLDRYDKDERIFLVTGCNFELNSAYVDEDYFFGLSGTNWGWATWKRNWEMMDYSCGWIANDYLWDNLKEKLTMFYGKRKANYEIKYFKRTYDKVKSGEKVDYWDIQWQAIRYLNNQLSIIPKKNLITNIGIGKESTHSKKINKPVNFWNNEGDIHFFYNSRYEIDFPLKHPNAVIENRKYDNLISKKLNPSLLKKVFIKLGIINNF